MVLRDLKREERCYVKHERKQGCFHITVREKKETTNGLLIEWTKNY